MDIARNGSRASTKGPPECFTGTVDVEPLFESNDARDGVRGASVTFQPGARSNWHTHPRGQTLIVTAGVGYVQAWGEAMRVIRAGDVVNCHANEKHWHGASADRPMTHIAIQEALNGRVVDWLEPVTDEQYAAAQRSG